MSEFPSITICKILNPERAQPLIAALQGQTYMNLRVEVCPFQGSYNVNVSTLRPGTTEQELTEIVLLVLSNEVCGIFARRPTISEAP